MVIGPVHSHVQPTRKGGPGVYTPGPLRTVGATVVIERVLARMAAELGTEASTPLPRRPTRRRQLARQAKAQSGW